MGPVDAAALDRPDQSIPDTRRTRLKANGILRAVALIDRSGNPRHPIGSPDGQPPCGDSHDGALGFTGTPSGITVGGLKLEIFTLCDSAVDYGGKVCILGAFDSVTAGEAPYTLAHCAVVARMRFHRIEEGNHKLRVTLADQDGRMIMPNVDAQVGVRFRETSQSATFNFVMQINGLKLDQFGEYTVDLAVDGVHQGSLPLYFARNPSAPSEPEAA